MQPTTFLLQSVIQDSAQAALRTLGVDTQEITLEKPAQPEFGDFSTNVAMAHFQTAQGKTQATNPRAFAQEIVTEIQKAELHPWLQKVEVAGGGFINFYVSDRFYTEFLSADQTELEISLPEWDKKKVIVEFTDPNPFKEFHIGHLYSNAVGESLSRLFEAAGAEVKRVCYQGDVGMHVAKSVWGLRKKMAQEQLTLDQLKQRTLPELVKYLGQAYALGATAYEEDETSKQEIREVNYLTFLSAQDLLVEQQGWERQVDYQKHLANTKLDYEEIKELYQTGRQWSLEYFEIIYQRLGTQFTDYYFESVVGEYGYKIVQEFLQKGVFKESQGAVIFPGSEYGLHDRVFINSLGFPTYEAKELGLAPEKFRRYAYDKSVIVTGNEIKDYFTVLLKALEVTNPELAAKTQHLSHGMVRLPDGKMSSRTGKILTGEWLVDESKARIAQVLETDRPHLTVEEKENIAEVVGISAVKYALLKPSLGSDIVFSFEESLSFQGNSGPYLEYTFVRAQSVLREAGSSATDIETDIKTKVETDAEIDLTATELNQDERTLTAVLSQFSEAVTKAIRTCETSEVAKYLFTLAQTFNGFYTRNQVLKADTPAQKKLRLILTQRTATTMKQGLHLLGISTVEKM